MGKIDILMATYNGAKYIAPQIRSLQNQTFEDWTLLVHDDGSTDQTMDIIKRFAKDDSRIRIVDDGIRFHNCALNFMHLLKISDAPFCIFCDQDDIWLENKLQVMFDFISSKNNDIPQGVYSNSYVYNPDTNEISGSASLCLPKTVKDILFMNAGIQGCALMFNAALRNICRKVPDIVAMHDHVLTLGAATFGELSYINKYLMLYRRHSTTVSGPTARKESDRIASFFNSEKRVLDKQHFLAIKSFVKTYNEHITAKDNEVFDDFFRFETENRFKRIIHIYAKNYKLYNKCSILAFKMLIRKLL